MQFRQHLSEYFQRKKVPAKCSRADIHIHASTEILDNRTCISYQYYIIIGRRNMIIHELQSRRHLVGLDKIEIVTYDRLLDVAKNLEKEERT